MSQADANQLYKQGDYAASAASYSQLLQQTQDAATRSIILSNRAACALAMQDPAAAEADCRAGIALNPVSAKLRLRLAKALTQQQQESAAAAEVAAAVALEKPEQPSSELLQLYQQVTAATGVSDGPPAAADTSSNRTVPVCSCQHIPATSSMSVQHSTSCSQTQGRSHILCWHQAHTR
jgi:tetratricopeptide (TPR) repeat protein